MPPAAQTNLTIVESSDNRLFAVNETNQPDLAHVWNAIPMKRVKGGYAVRGTGRMILLRKAGCRFIHASFATVEDFGVALSSTLPTDLA